MPKTKKDSEKVLLNIHRNNLIYLARVELRLPKSIIADVFGITRQSVDRILKQLGV